MNLNDYFEPVYITVTKNKRLLGGYFQSLLESNDHTLKKISIALFSVSTTERQATFSTEIRKNLYQLTANFSKSFKAVDLGEIKKGSTFSDVLYATRDVCEYLLSKNIIPIIISDNSYLPYAVYLAYESSGNPVTISNIDYTVVCKPNNQHFISQILSRKNHTLFNYNLLGYQIFYTLSDELHKAQSLFFNALRLGDLQSDIKKAEHYLRDSYLLIIHSTAMLNAYLNEFNANSPSGFTHKEICQIARYAGISERMSGFYLFTDPHSSFNQLTYAQIIWHFIEGFSARTNDYPNIPFKKLIKYHVEVTKDVFITFYKSPISGRWWMEIPVPRTNFKKKWLTSCDEQDYIDACNGNVPERWHKAIKKVY